MASFGKQGKICPHTAVKCPNCGGIHPEQDARCKAKGATIQIARGGRAATPRPETREELECSRAPPPTLTTGPGPQGSDKARNSGSSGPLNWVPVVSLATPPAEWTVEATEDAMETAEEESSGVAPHVAI